MKDKALEEGERLLVINEREQYFLYAQYFSTEHAAQLPELKL